jgi:hypothetical protein
MVQRRWLQQEAARARRRAWRLETPRAVSACEYVRVTAMLRERDGLRGAAAVARGAGEHTFFSPLTSSSRSK